MKRPLPAPWCDQLLKHLKMSNRENRDLHELTAVLLQISLAIMLIFMIAFFLFIDKVGGEIDQLEHLKTQLNVARQHQLQQKIVQVTEYYRERYALKTFRKLNLSSGASTYTVWDIIRHGKIQRRTALGQEFCRGARAAHADYSDIPQLQSAWLNRVQEKIPDCTRCDRPYLQAQISEQINYLQHEIGELQAVAAAQIQEFLVSHPEQVRHQPIRRLLRKIQSTSDAAQREALLHELHRQLRVYVYDRLTRQTGVPMGELK